MTTQRLLKIQNTSITQAWQIVPGAMTVNSRTKIGQSAALVKLASLVMKQANLANTGELHVFSFATCATAGFSFLHPKCSKFSNSHVSPLSSPDFFLMNVTSHLRVCIPLHSKRGKYSANAATECSICDDGQFLDKGYAATACANCPVGTSALASDARVLNCTECVPGKYAGRAQGTCTDCEAGYFSGAGVEECTKCIGESHLKEAELTSCL